VHSHIHALGQCRKIIRKHRWKALVAGDTAGAAKLVAEDGDKTRRRLRRNWPPNCTGSRSSRRDIEDTENNVTRFVVLSKDKQEAKRDRCRREDDDHLRLPRAQHTRRALQGDGRFRHQRRQHDQAGKLSDSAASSSQRSSTRISRATPTMRNVTLAFEELGFFSEDFRILGVYKAAGEPRRHR
jgi:prephenate dehydratase